MENDKNGIFFGWNVVNLNLITTFANELKQKE